MVSLDLSYFSQLSLTFAWTRTQNFLSLKLRKFKVPEFFPAGVPSAHRWTPRCFLVFPTPARVTRFRRCYYSNIFREWRPWFKEREKKREREQKYLWKRSPFLMFSLCHMEPSHYRKELYSAFLEADNSD